MNRSIEKPCITNADRIRAMTDEEIAEWMLKFENPYYPICPPIHNAIGDCPTSPCEICWLDWLQSPVEEGEG